MSENERIRYIWNLYLRGGFGDYGSHFPMHTPQLEWRAALT